MSSKLSLRNNFMRRHNIKCGSDQNLSLSRHHNVSFSSVQFNFPFQFKKHFTSYFTSEIVTCQTH